MSETVNANAGSRVESASLPDLNAETYSFETVQYLIDKAAYFNLFSVPDNEAAEPLIQAADSSSSNGIIGFNIREKLLRFQVNLRSLSTGNQLQCDNLIGERVGRSSQRWLLMPDEYVAQPESGPPPTLLDTTRSQRFVISEGNYSFGAKEEGFGGFGTGCTYPIRTNNGQQLLVAAVGNMTDGTGRFGGREGTYTYCGVFDPQRGFTGNLLIRVVDPDDSLVVSNDLPELEQKNVSGKGLTFILFRGQKKNQYQKTRYNFSAAGEPQGFTVEQELRRYDLDCAVLTRKGISGTKRLGEVIGRMTSTVFLNLLNPGAPGTARQPITFTTYNEYTFFDNNGQEIGSFAAVGGEGRSFNLRFKRFPEQQVLRFGAFQSLVNGAGQFSGIQGLLTDNSVAGIAPHALSTLYMLCINDPDGKYGTCLSEACM